MKGLHWWSVESKGGQLKQGGIQKLAGISKRFMTVLTCSARCLANSIAQLSSALWSRLIQ